jgi:predicted ATPase
LRQGGSLPNELSSFVGGQERIAEVATRLGTARLVTLTGVGGIGKTRWRCERALRATSTRSARVTLSSTVDADRIGGLIAVALSVPRYSGRASKRSFRVLAITHRCLCDNAST